MPTLLQQTHARRSKHLRRKPHKLAVYKLCNSARTLQREGPLKSERE